MTDDLPGMWDESDLSGGETDSDEMWADIKEQIEEEFYLSVMWGIGESPGKEKDRRERHEARRKARE